MHEQKKRDTAVKETRDAKEQAGKLESSVQGFLELKDKNGFGVHVTKEAMLRIATMPTTFSDSQIKQVIGHDVQSLHTIRRARIRVASCIMANADLKIRQKIIDALPPCVGPLKFEPKQDALANDFLKYDLELAESLLPALDPLAEVSRSYVYQFDSLCKRD